MSGASSTGKKFRHFLDLDALEPETLREILDQAAALKAARKGQPQGMLDAGAPLKDHVLAMIFEKNSTRTRVSFDVGMRQLGGETLILTAQDSQIGRGETAADTARVLSRYVDGIMLRGKQHKNLLDLAEFASVPVINGLTDLSHPCQIMADLLTIEERIGRVDGKVIAWSGDGNNMVVSWIHAAAKLGFTLRLACPEQLLPRKDVLDWAASQGADVTLTADPAAAVADADCVMTDTWVSMGDTDADRRMKLLAPFRVDAALMSRAKPDAVFLHCLPAHRGEEVTDEVIDGPQSAVWDEAENRLHVQKGILLWCFGKSVNR
ncbi:MAG TPA: ornithine carbamoyltransferase [Alphaproteobacteria bacterium]|jgi:ornithine carbamoyltransferase|nr:ornithine carbamoyltransferase [Alphaproteobacteria bacterium]